MADFTLRGRKYTVEKQQVIDAVKGKEPRPIQRYYMKIKGVKYPIKQPVELALKIPTPALTTIDAYRILDKLGFTIEQSEG